MQAVRLGQSILGTLLLALSGLVGGCGATTGLDGYGDGGLLCDPGEEIACVCPGGGIGTQLCGPDRSFFDCQCDGVGEKKDASIEEAGVPDSSPPIGGGPSSGDITCGILAPDRCDVAAGERCCILVPGIDHCIGPDESCECTGPDCLATVAECDGPEDCDDGQVCCGTFSGEGYSRIKCQASCDEDDQRELCHPNGPACSTQGAICERSPSLPLGYHRCE